MEPTSGDHVVTAIPGPTGSRALTDVERGALDEQVVSSPLAGQLFRMHDRIYLSVGTVEPHALTEVFGTWPASLGLHVTSCASKPELAPWIAWSDLGQVAHLSFAESGLSFGGLRELLESGRVAQLRSLDLGRCNIGPKGLRLLRSSNHVAGLEELYLTANPADDRSKRDAKTLQDLLKPTKRSPIGKTLRGLKVLGLMNWAFEGAKSLLESSRVVQELDILQVHVEADGLPASLLDRCVRASEKVRSEAPEPDAPEPAPTDAPPSYTVTLERVGPSRVMTIRALAMSLHITLGEARGLLESLPLQLAAKCERARKDELEKAFTDVGAVTRIDRV